MALFPFFIEMQNKSCLITGGGEVAARRSRALLEAGAVITIIAEQINKDIQELLKTENNYSDNINWIQRKLVSSRKDNFADDLMIVITEDLIDPYFAVIAATGDPEADKLIIDFCQKKNILASAAFDSENSDCYFPAVVRCGPVVAGISSSGCSPSLSAIIAEDLKDCWTPWLGVLTGQLADIRTICLHNQDTYQRRKLLKEIALKGWKHKAAFNQKEFEKIIKNCEGKEGKNE